jgi:hypothetical protein
MTISKRVNTKKKKEKRKISIVHIGMYYIKQTCNHITINSNITHFFSSCIKDNKCNTPSQHNKKKKKIHTYQFFMTTCVINKKLKIINI